MNIMTVSFAEKNSKITIEAFQGVQKVIDHFARCQQHWSRNAFFFSL